MDTGTNPLAVWAARKFFYLPYFQAAISVRESTEGFDYSSVRHENSVTFRARYRPTSDVYASGPGSLEAFLTERYCLYARAPDGSLLRSEVHHPRWPLQHAEADIPQMELHHPYELPLAGPPETLHFSKRIDVVIWSPVSVPQR